MSCTSAGVNVRRVTEARLRRLGLRTSHSRNLRHADMGEIWGKYCWASSLRPKVLIVFSIVFIVYCFMVQIYEIILRIHQIVVGASA